LSFPHDKQLLSQNHKHTTLTCSQPSGCAWMCRMLHWNTGCHLQQSAQRHGQTQSGWQQKVASALCIRRWLRHVRCKILFWCRLKCRWDWHRVPFFFVWRRKPKALGSKVACFLWFVKGAVSMSCISFFLWFVKGAVSMSCISFYLENFAVQCLRLLDWQCNPSLN